LKPNQFSLTIQTLETAEQKQRETPSKEERKGFTVAEAEEKAEGSENAEVQAR